MLNPFGRCLALLGAALAFLSPFARAADTVRPPTIYAFNQSGALTINLGEKVGLNWSVGGATEVSLSPDIGVVTGTWVEVVPTQTTTYTLTARNSAGSVSKTKKITVVVPPVVGAFTATPAEIMAGATARLNWSAPGATSYQIVADVGSSPGQLFTNTTTVRPTATTTYTITARNSAGTSTTKTLTLPVTPLPPKPTITSFTAAPASVVRGSPTTLSWAVNGATSLSISPGIGAVTGTSVSATPTANTTYTLTATNAGGSVTKKVTVAVTVPPPVIAALTATPASITAGTSTTLDWSVTGAAALELTANVGAGPGAVTGTSRTVTPAASTVYTLRATNTEGVSVTRTVAVTVTVPPPVIAAFTAAPASVLTGEAVTLSWSVEGAASLSISPAIGAVTGTSVVIHPTVNTTYVLTATNTGGHATRTVAVTVTNPEPLPVIAAFAAAPASIAPGGSTTLNWSVSGAAAVSIAASTGASPGVVTGNSVSVSPTASTTYTLTAANNTGGSVTRSVGVTVTTPEPLPVIGGFAASPASIALGGSTTLSWSVSGAASVAIAANTGASPGVVTGTSVSVSPAANTTYTLTATSTSGGSVTQMVGVAVAAPPLVPVNLFADPRFESGVSHFVTQDASSAVVQSAVAPLEGVHSLRVSIAGYGNNVWWIHEFEGGRASHFLVRARARSDVASSSTLMFSAMIYFADGTTTLTQVPVSGAAGDKGVVTVQTPIDPAKRLASVRLRLIQEGGAPVSFTFDEAEAYLEVVEAPPVGGGGGGDGGGGGGGPIGCPPVEADDSVYPGFTYHLPAARPFISLASYTQAAQTASAYPRFRAAADRAVAGNPPYGYSAVSSVMMYRITGNPVYITDAITRVERFVVAAEAAIAAGGRPAIAGDSYLEIGWFIEQLATAYDSGFDRLTPEQRTRWAAFADQALFNLWHPSDATWGGVAYPWTGWSICDPGNNYHFHFLRATMLWALATKSAPLLEFLQTAKFQPLIAYYAALPGGGSREGTGYGTAQKDLFENYLMWKDSTGEDLSELASHTRQTIDYWVHATVPTLDRFAPIGDQSRSSMPNLYDYQENLVHTAVVLNPGTPEARRGTWWLNHNSVNGVGDFNLKGDMLPLPDAPMAPTERVYHAEGAGVLFARSSWNTDAAWFSFMAGKYDQSHAHQDQGAFTFFKRDWLAVTANIWSDSGINLETVYHNTVRFERADGSVIAQNPSDTVQSTMTYTTAAGGQVNVAADLRNAFSRNASLVQQWRRDVEFNGDTLRIFDTCTVAPGVRPVFQVHVPVLPVLQEDGSLRAGNLRIVRIQGASFTINTLPTGFSRGYRIDFTSTAGNSFAIELSGL